MMRFLRKWLNLVIAPLTPPVIETGELRRRYRG